MKCSLKKKRKEDLFKHTTLVNYKARKNNLQGHKLIFGFFLSVVKYGIYRQFWFKGFKGSMALKPQTWPNFISMVLLDLYAWPWYVLLLRFHWAYTVVESAKLA